MAKTVEYASYIIDLTDAMLEQRDVLSNPQIEHLQVIQKHAVRFVNRYFRKEKHSLEALLRFLQREAAQHINIIISYNEVLLMDHLGTFDEAFKEACYEIAECAYELRAEVRQLQRNLESFKAALG